MFLSTPYTSQVSGTGNLPKEGAYIIAANHQTMFDGLDYGWHPQEQLRASPVLPDLTRTTLWLTGRIMFRVGKAIPIDREGNPMRARAQKQPEKGAVIMIHPEGTRTYDGRLGQMKNGVAYLARKTGVPIVPTYIDGGMRFFHAICPYRVLSIGNVSAAKDDH